MAPPSGGSLTDGRAAFGLRQTLNIDASPAFPVRPCSPDSPRRARLQPCLPPGGLSSRLGACSALDGGLEPLNHRPKLPD